MDQPTAPTDSRIRPLIRPSVILIVVQIAFIINPPLASAQSQVTLPGIVSIPTPRLELNLATAQVVVRVDSEEAPSLAARAAVPEDAASLSLVVDSTDPLVTRISRPETDVDVPTVVIEIDLRSGQTLDVVGISLDLEIASAVECEKSTSESSAARLLHPVLSDPRGKNGDLNNQTSTMSVDLSDSVFQGRCLPSLRLSATRGSNHLESVKGNLDLTLQETIVSIRNHQGQLAIRAIDSDLDLEEFNGTISLDFQGGSITGVDGSSTLTGKVVNAGIDLRSLAGSIQLTGSDSSIRISDSSISPNRISGVNNMIDLDSLIGSVNYDLRGGNLNGQDLQARVDLSLADAAEGTLRSIEGDVVVSATGGSRIAISEITKHARLQLDDSELEVSQLKSLELNARRSMTNGGEVRELSNIVLSASEMYLSLPDLRGRPKILATDESYVQLEIPTPCSVIAKSSSTFILDHFEVAGCNLVAPGTKRRQVQPGVNGRPPVLVYATVDDSSTIEITGSP